MENDILLTVAIPTYNRSVTLEKILQHLSNERDVPFKILVSDDQSPDDTGDMVRRFQGSLPQLRYHRNEKNLGFSGNVLKLYELADTRYVWFLCDDETVLPGAIRNIVTALKKYEPSVAVFNYSWDDPYGRRSFAVSNTDVVYEQQEDLIDYQPLLRITFLSILVVEKRHASIDVPKSVYEDNVFIQVTLALILLSERFKYCEIGVPIVHRNVGYKYGDFFKFNLVDVLKSVHATKHKFENQKFIERMIRELPVAFRLYLSQKLGLFRYVQQPTQDTMDKIAQYYGNYKYFIYSFRYFKMLTPAFLLKFIYWLQLLKMHGWNNASKIYKLNINRAYSDERKTGFTEYK